MLSIGSEENNKISQRNVIRCKSIEEKRNLKKV
jgi:hypothetical protein